MAITYLVSVIAAVVARRAIAVHVHALGPTTGDIVVRGWDGQGFSAMFGQQLVGLTPSLIASAEQHLANPVLHYFHADRTSLAASLALARLDDALFLLSRGVAPGSRPDPSAVEPLREALRRYVDTATAIAWVPDADTPPAPDTALLARAGLPVARDRVVRDALDADAEHRRRLHQLVTGDGWTWPAGQA